MNNNIKTVEHKDELISEYNRLAMMNEIPNMAEYAAQWTVLALIAEAKNRPALAEHARSHAKHYAEYDNGEYIKLVEGPLSELFLVSPLAGVA